ncbi:unnamed protein product [Rhizoctonia solani]|uniref:Uncharacterized protein n=1 Tax=Rhizoctonia solani TaxID=456999 RepID=A0A8H2WI28_9AGAM|nr:unnamed protein product [Rhizoctonia solani]
MTKPQRSKRSQPPRRLAAAKGSPSGRRVIEIPELFILIVHELDDKQQRNLMRVSKYFFRSIGPIAWRRVPRLDIVMKLIKNVVVDLQESWADFKWQFMITLPPRLNLSRYNNRYNIYAPWVQELEVYGGHYQEMTNPEVFLVFLDGRAPLPNLRRLTTSTSAPVAGDDLMHLLDMFICPSLTELRTIMPNKGLPRHDFSRVVSSSVSEFLQKVKDTCPHIEVLEFYPDGMVRFDQRGYDRYIPTDQCKNVLSSFLGLRSFSSTTYILKSDVLGILGQLPHLESLGIRGASTEPPAMDKKPSVPEIWFPALKDLRLYDVAFEDIQFLWNETTIIKKIASVLFQIDYRNRRRSIDGFSYVQNWVGPFLEALPRLSPQLQDIHLYLGSEDERVEVPRDKWDIFRADNDLCQIFYYYKAGLEPRYTALPV